MIYVLSVVLLNQTGHLLTLAYYCVLNALAFIEILEFTSQRCIISDRHENYLFFGVFYVFSCIKRIYGMAFCCCLKSFVTWTEQISNVIWSLMCYFQSFTTELLFLFCQLQVRSITLDVKVWEPAILDLFRNLGNAFSNSVWEGLLHDSER